MNQGDVKNQIFKTLDSPFKSKGFKAIKGKNAFIKKNQEGFWRVSFGITDYDPEFWIRFALSIRRDEVADIYNQFAAKNPKTFGDTTTLLIMEGDLKGLEEFHYTAFDLPEVVQSCHIFLDFMNNEGWAFFEEFDDIKKMDKLFNEAPNEPTPFSKRELTRIMNGLIIAKKAKNPNFDALARAYKNLIKEYDDDDKARLNDLIVFLTTD